MNLDTNAILNHFASTLFSALTPPAKGMVYCVTIILVWSVSMLYRGRSPLLGRAEIRNLSFNELDIFLTRRGEISFLQATICI